MIIKYNLGIGYKDMEGFLESRPKLLKKLKLEKVPSKSNLNRVYWWLDNVWFRKLNDRTIAQVENQERSKIHNSGKETK